jgi:hypothetical protein
MGENAAVVHCKSKPLSKYMGERNWNGSASEHTVAFLVLKICGAYLPNTKRFFGRKCLRVWRVILDLRCLQSNTNNVFIRIIASIKTYSETIKIWVGQWLD